MKDILDFTDYAKPIDFKYGDDLYRIPAFNKSQIEKLMQFANKTEKIEKLKDEDNPDDEIKINEEESFLESQDDYLAVAVFKKVAEVFQPTVASDFVDWPIKVKNRVMREINEQMSATVSEDKEPEKKS